jgi:hypothetical protein
VADEIHVNPWFLQICLATAVPLWIEHYKSWSPSARQAEGERLGDCISISTGLLVKIPTNRAYRHEGTAAGFNAAARGLALGAYMPGGVTAFGLHFEQEPQPRSRKECAYPKCCTRVDPDTCGWLPGFEGKRYACGSHEAAVEVGEAA